MGLASSPLWIVGTWLLTIAPLHACSQPFTGCEEERTCRQVAAAAGHIAGSATAGSAGAGGSEPASGGADNVDRPNDSGSASGDAAGGGSAGQGTEVALRRPCDGACSGSTPICNEASDTCVECLASRDCPGTKKLCDANACVACLTSIDCKDPAAPRCDAKACTKCISNDDCAHIEGKRICDTRAGQCVQCTVADEAVCDGKSCDPASNSCTATEVGSKVLCEPCVADSECIGGNQADAEARCVPMTYSGMRRPGGFCLRRLAKTCRRPFSIRTTQTSLSGAGSEEYCGINEQITKCEAVLDLMQGRSCPSAEDAECGCIRDQDGNCVNKGEAGFCRTVGTFANQCTYSCGTNTQCPDGFTCPITSSQYCE